MLVSRPARWGSDDGYASPSPACRAPARPSVAGVVPSAPFGDRGRVSLVPGDYVDLVDLDLAPEPHRWKPGDQAGAELLGHELHVRLAQAQLLGDLPVREVEAHEVQAQHPDP